MDQEFRDQGISGTEAELEAEGSSGIKAKLGAEGSEETEAELRSGNETKTGTESGWCVPITGESHSSASLVRSMQGCWRRVS